MNLPTAILPPDDAYTLTIDLNVLKHLGINLYSNVPAVLTEIVANAWDAEANEVYISIDDNLDFISISDNGFGMSRGSINRKFLWVGYEKRTEDGDVTPNLHRPVMGRKGVGKLAPFSIAKVVEVHSTHNGEKNALSMSVEGITAAAESQPKKTYHPTPIPPKNCPESNGTTIVLKDLNRDKIRVENLAQRLARRFSVIGTEEFKVYIKRNGQTREITNKDRGDLEKLQYLWTIGDWEKPEWLKGKTKREATLPDRLDAWNSNWSVRGWIGTASKPKDLDSIAGNLNTIVILARGRLFQENILGDYNDGRHYLKYLTGHLEVDFLDNSGIDIATSDRQRIQEDDPRYIALRAYLKSVLSKLESNWSSWRAVDKVSDIRKIHPNLDIWLNKFTGGHKKHAERIIGKIASFDIEDPAEEKTLLKHAILGFERLKITGSTQELADAISVGTQQLLPLLADIDSYEASLYRDIVNGRLDVIRSFRSKIQNNDLERVLQEYLFTHLWLIDPSWERAQGSEIIEKNVDAEFDKIDAGLTPQEKAGRIDIKYKKTTGKHVIIELKRPERSVSVQELVAQGYKYRTALLKCLKAAGRENEPFEIIFVIGRPLKEDGDHSFIDSQFSSINGRAVQFEQLLQSAEEGYKLYLDAKLDLDATQKLLNSLDS